MRPLFRRLVGALAALLLTTASACAAPGPNGAGQLSQASPLNIGLAPSPAIAGPGRDSPLATYLEKAMGRLVQLKVEPSLAVLAADLRASRVDVAFVSDVGYLAVARAALVHVIGQAAAAPASPPAILCSAASGVKPVTDGGDWSSLRGRTVLFGASGSLGANVWPRYFMMRNGLDPIGDVTTAIVVPNERQAILEVYNGIADCTATASDSRSSVAEVAPDVADRVQMVFAAPSAVPPAPQVARPGLDPALIKRFEQAMAAVQGDPAAAAVAGSVMGAAAARSASDRDYALLRSAIETVDPSLVTRAI